MCVGKVVDLVDLGLASKSKYDYVAKRGWLGWLWFL